MISNLRKHVFLCIICFEEKPRIVYLYCICLATCVYLLISEDIGVSFSIYIYICMYICIRICTFDFVDIFSSKVGGLHTYVIHIYRMISFILCF